MQVLPPTQNTKRAYKGSFCLSRRSARVMGLEPTASSVTGKRSNQLSYTRIRFIVSIRLCLPRCYLSIIRGQNPEGVQLISVLLSHLRGSNSGPLLYESIALPTELRWQSLIPTKTAKVAIFDTYQNSYGCFI